jgi:hypothetical protein
LINFNVVHLRDGIRRMGDPHSAIHSEASASSAPSRASSVSSESSVVHPTVSIARQAF